MTNADLSKLLACPRCKTTIQPISQKGKCKKCGFVYKNMGGIWDFLYIADQKTQTSRTEYDSIHKKDFGGPTDGSYEILASIARGNKTIDIACGQGILEKLAPETVGVEFSYKALKRAKRDGAKYLVLADAHALPFKDDSFDIAISNGNLEHFSDPQKAINEMARVSRIQVQTVHQYPPIPFAALLHRIVTILLKIKHQPIEKPIQSKEVIKMIKKAGLHVVYKGVWTLPLNYGRPIKLLPEFKNLPCVSFIISIKNN